MNVALLEIASLALDLLEAEDDELLARIDLARDQLDDIRDRLDELAHGPRLEVVK